MEERTGFVAEVQHYCIQDGPGTRTTVFLKGCPLRCKWCHNPEMIAPKPEVWYNGRLCTMCGRCNTACPEDAIRGYRPVRRIDREACLAAEGCTECVKACPTGAMEIVGKKAGVPELVEEVRRDAAFYRRNGGGACISGGEPTMQADFAAAFLEECRSSYIDTAVESCAYSDWENLKKVAAHADLMMIDIKHMNPEKHKEGTGAPNAPILENIAKLAAEGVKVRIRLPLIPGFNDDRENLEATASFMSDHGLKYIDLLPFHAAGDYKYGKLCQDYACATMKEPTEADMMRHRAIFARRGIGGTIGGADVDRQ
jgi:pyruvate formate lyase activating enzyme